MVEIPPLVIPPLPPDWYPSPLTLDACPCGDDCLARIARVFVENPDLAAELSRTRPEENRALGSIRHRQRLMMGSGAVYSLGQAAALLPWADTEARAWLRRTDLVSKADGREVVVWAAVLETLANRPLHSSPERPESSTPLPRARLDPIGPKRSDGT